MSDRRFIAVVSAAAILLTSVPMLFALALSVRTGNQWTGLQSLSPGDLSVYLSYIAQVKQGALLISDWHTTEHVAPVLNVLWLAVGLLARAFSLSPLVAYHVSRILLIPALAASAHALFAYFFPDPRRRRIGTALFLFGSGLGPFFSGVLTGADSGPGTFQRPIDLWVGESNAFLSMGYSPHFIASLALILLCALFFLRAVDHRSRREAVLAGSLGLLLFEFHPFHAPTLYAVFFSYVAFRAVARGVSQKGLSSWGHSSGRWFSRDDAVALALFILISLPAVFYHYWLTHHDAGAKALLLSNLCLTPAVWNVIIGLGIVVPLSLLGIALAKLGQGPRAWPFLVVWAAAQFALLYSPLSFQRRLVEGIQFPLVALAVPVVESIGVRLNRMRGVGVALMVPASVFAASWLFFSSSFDAAATNVALYRANRPPLFFLSPDASGALAWIRTESPIGSITFGSFDSGNLVAGWGERPTYAGHWVNTIDIGRKSVEITQFFGRMRDDERREFAREHGIAYVYWGPKERSYGGAAPVRGFESEYRSSTVTVYRVLP